MHSFLCICLIAAATAAPLQQTESPDARFTRSDADRTDSLTFDEFLHTDLEYEKAKKEEFDVLDTNEDGIISRAEYDSHYSTQKQDLDDLQAEYFGKLFEQFDADEDMEISEDEIKTLLAKRFFVQPTSSFPATFSSFDVDQSGGLDVSEYMAFDKGFNFDDTQPLASSTLAPKKSEKKPFQKMNKEEEEEEEDDTDDADIEAVMALARQADSDPSAVALAAKTFELPAQPRPVSAFHVRRRRV